jgi:hypothetical protein
MQMFGIIPYDDRNYIRAGYEDVRGRGIQICSVVNANVLPGENYFEKYRSFIESFRKISSNPVGRVLLYRILIEIRRKNNSEGCQESPIIAPNFIKRMEILKTRNKLRRISIANADSSAFRHINAVLRYHDIPVETTAIVEKNADHFTIARHETSADVGLIHEMIHWYHALRNYKRLTDELGLGNDKKSLGMIGVGRIYYTVGIDDDLYDKWLIDDGKNISFEDMRTIFGSIEGENVEYLNGDDISENLYRLYRGDTPLRYGYVTFNGIISSYFVRKDVIEKVERVPVIALQKYKI